ncbi:MAG: carbohydrate porin [Xanthobacteraceae bacterium]|nr:carbohydrate porin [Xanthobacteraceae bacterium]
MKIPCAIVIVSVLEGPLGAMAAEISRPPASKNEIAVPSHRWSGLYAGPHFGYGGGSFGADTNPLLLQGVLLPATVTGLIGGYQVGYNFQLSNHVVFGIEGDATFLSPVDHKATGTDPFNTTLNYFATVRGRIGYAFGDVLPYLTGGFAWGQSKVERFDAAGDIAAVQSANHAGWTIGAGVEYALDRRWSAKLEYNYVDLGARTHVLNDAAGTAVNVNPNLHLVKAGLNYKLTDGGSSVWPAFAAPESPKSDRWNVHGQTTLIVQGYPTFRSPYQGANSLPGGGLTRETWTSTLFVGWRLWEGGEFFFNPELAQGFGIGSTLGLAGFSNGEAQKGGAPYPRVRAQRYFFRQTIGFGGEQETVEDGPNQFGGKRDIDRLTVTVGRFAIGDIFDANSYAHDPRMDFSNWALWSSAAYDFPADLPGFTRGVVVELNRKYWTLRGGVFQVPEEPNSDVLTFKTGGAVVEYEQRYDVLGQPGKFRVGSFINRGRTANYRQVVAAAAANPAIDINDATFANREQRLKYGFYLNGEQAVGRDLGVFGRFSWNDGQNEILSFTDIDRSLSGGISLKGSAWKRPDDVIGLGGAINGLSEAHRDFLANGGLGLLIGDGALNYRQEKIIEAYYSYRIDKSAALTFDYQFISNPAYNADRGSVSIFGCRFHAEF